MGDLTVYPFKSCFRVFRPAQMGGITIMVVVRRECCETVDRSTIAHGSGDVAPCQSSLSGITCAGGFVPWTPCPRVSSLLL